MAGNGTDVITCPYCGAENIRGSENCVSCGQALYGIELPDWATAQQETQFTLPISAIRISRARTIAPRATVREAMQILNDDPTGAAVVTEGQRIVGILTERDIAMKIAATPPYTHGSRTAGSVVSGPPGELSGRRSPRHSLAVRPSVRFAPKQ